MLNSVLTARLVLNLREAGEAHPSVHSTSYERMNHERWEMRVLSKVVDDFDDDSCQTRTSRHVKNGLRGVGYRFSQD